MKFTFLGTGTSQGVPMIGCTCEVCTSADLKDKRLRSSLMVESDSHRFVIDSGPDFRQQMLREKVDSLDGIVFTHEHKDHIAGLDDVRAFNYLNHKAMDVYASEAVQLALKREFFYIFNGDNYPGIPKINLHTIDEQPFEASGIKFIPIPVMHMRLPVLGFRMGGFSYITDANFISDKSKELLLNSEVLVLNSLRREKHVSHFNLEEAMELVDELKPKMTYLTHISHQLGKHEEVEQELPDNIRLAYDGLAVILD
ncbi:MAG TPA: MBL fold metallo-hydrolase [Bacteroidia bacterium]|jgi:phosphoribosyl 1,2-cyclic phosphate phosphodiesterase|nr:MBL fold metallo-hydrolase [Bacteroidia bacterium]MBP9923698.1 MBL fold metallo-hydrolase [Bacteroidia bacterium]HQW23292.1 MBL fold metallo-hydrolase [Bacteroidia bacterium]